MKEHSVRYGVHEPEREEVARAPASAAPMVARAFRLLDLLAEAEEGPTLSELARALRMSKGSLHGLLKTLEGSQVVQLGPDRRYILGPRVFDLAQRYVQRAGLRRFALPAMLRLAAATGEMILLGRVEPEGVRIVERADPPLGRAGLRVSAARGTRVHLLAGATGRVVLASWPRERREEYLRARALPGFTAQSITDPEEYLAAVEETVRTGLGVDREEYLAGVNAVAAPIHGPDGALVALLWAVGFSAHLGGDALDRAGQQIRAAAESISHALGAGGLSDGRDGREGAEPERQGETGARSGHET